MAKYGIRLVRFRQKKEKLITVLKKTNRLAVAFSGGVDSSFLMFTARDVLGDEAMAFMSTGLPHSQRETRQAVSLMESMGVPFQEVPTIRMRREPFTDNTKDRCYQCKKIMWTEIAAAAAKMNIFRLADGVSADDLDEFRPGLVAGREMGVTSPLAEAGLTKAEIRVLAREAGLSNWDKPSTPCLATRIPYGTRLTTGRLAMIETAENFLIELGFPQCRVRYHDDMARIEIPEEELDIMASGTFREKIKNELKRIGFTHVTMDLGGYISGSMDILPRSNQ